MHVAETYPFHRSAGLPAQQGTIVACVDRSDQGAWIVPHAFTLARALGAPLTLLQVLEAQSSRETRPDPIEWDLRCHEARRTLRRLAETPGSSFPNVGIALAEGLTADEISRFVAEQPDSFVVLGTHARKDLPCGGIGGTAHNVLSRAAGPILLVPPNAKPKPDSYRRIVVPLDGSCWAESVLPVATRLARAADAELVLAHIVPSPELTVIRPLELEDQLLRQRVVERNDATARTYLERIRSNLVLAGLRVRVLTLQAEDVRPALTKLIRDEDADLVVLSARGQGGSRHHDMRFGNVSAYLMTHCAAPMLILQSAPRRAPPLDAAYVPGMRLPLARSA